MLAGRRAFSSLALLGLVPPAVLGAALLCGDSTARADDTAATQSAAEAAEAERHARMGHGAAATAEGLEIRKVLRAPTDFVGNVAYDAASRRLVLTSFGPPANTKGPSFLYEIDPESGEVSERAKLPFLGEFGGGAIIDDALYQVVPYQSTLYKIDLRKAQFGQVVSSVKLPTLNDLKLDNDVYRFPFIAFTGAAAMPDGTLVLYASDLGELMTVDKQSGAIRRRVRTSKGLAGLAAVPFGDGRALLLASFDPIDSAFRQEQRRYMFRSAHGILPLETVRAEGNYGNPGQKTVTWVLLDPETGEVLAVVATETTRLLAGSVAVASREDAPGTRYGRLTVWTTGEEGVLSAGWIPR